ncbi:hypothetical protein E3E23_05805 [Thermococcus sp. CX2]|uniref:hypothetical protein n=1 Tax=Thermococcus sp. CX2 TaxID=163006 RepID=UPI00143ABF8A|nr:hypothetical protein [Thermococcus sp. CX2]NJE85337.1 hypothetical protein [Thermococcus sp. CX2]
MKSRRVGIMKERQFQRSSGAFFELSEGFELEEVHDEELNLDELADIYFSPILNVKIGVKRLKVFKIRSEDERQAYLIRGFLFISNKLVDKKFTSGAFADIVLVRISADEVWASGTLNNRPVTVMATVEPQDWFVDALMYVASAFLRGYGEKNLVKFSKQFK